MAYASAPDVPRSRVLIDGAGWELVSEGHRFTEGPAVDPHGNVFFTDIPSIRIFRTDGEERVSVFTEDAAKTNGLMFVPDGRLDDCRNCDKQIAAWSRDGTVDSRLYSATAKFPIILFLPGPMTNAIPDVS